MGKIGILLKCDFNILEFTLQRVEKKRCSLPPSLRCYGGQRKAGLQKLKTINCGLDN
jgi:hypothetical protein